MNKIIKMLKEYMYIEIYLLVLAYAISVIVTSFLFCIIFILLGSQSVNFTIQAFVYTSADLFITFLLLENILASIFLVIQKITHSNPFIIKEFGDFPK